MIKTISRFFKSNIILYILSITGAVVGFLLNVVLSRILSIEELDKVKYLVSLCTTISNLLVIGLPTYIVREIGSNKKNDNLISNCCCLYLSFSLFASPIIFYILFNYLRYSTNDLSLSIIVIIVSILLGITMLFSSLLLGRRKYKLSTLVETIIPKSILLIFCAILFGLNRANLISDIYLYVYLIIYGIIFIIFLLKEFRKLCINFSKKDVLTLAFLYGTTICQILTSSLSTILQSNLFPEVVGVTSTISTCSLLMSVVGVFTNVVNSITKPSFAKCAKENDMPKLLDTFEFGTRVNLYISIPIYLFFACCPSQFLIIFGENLIKYPLILTLIAVTHLFSSAFGTSGALMVMTGHERKQLINTIIQFITFLICVFIFRSNSIYGLVLCTMISEIVITLIKFIELFFIFKKSPFSLKNVIYIAIIFVVNFGAIFGFGFIIVNNPMIWFAIAIPIGLILLCLNIFATKIGRQDFKRLMRFKE